MRPVGILGNEVGADGILQNVTILRGKTFLIA